MVAQTTQPHDPGLDLPPELAIDTAVARRIIVGFIREQLRQAGFDRVVLGLSGGIDSAVTAAVAADALGPENVLGVCMPTPASLEQEVADAEQVARNLGIVFQVVPVGTVMAAVGEGLAPVLEGRPTGGTRQDLLARMRGAVLQAISDELGHLALATGNKTELSIGSAAIFGDMAGGFAPLKDCPKTLLYRLAEHRNRLAPVVPERILSRVPTALLGEDDALPPYELLDPIIERYVEKGEGLEEIVAAGFDATVVRGVLQLIDDAEFKRRQTPLGVKITARAFGKDRRMPIANAWRPFRRDKAELAATAEEAAAAGAPGTAEEAGVSGAPRPDGRGAAPTEAAEEGAGIP